MKYNPVTYGDKNQYCSLYHCPICQSMHKVIEKDTIDLIICEAETECGNCGHSDYWAYGHYESMSYQGE